jgi:hypothetical protein
MLAIFDRDSCIRAVMAVPDTATHAATLARCAEQA